MERVVRQGGERSAGRGRGRQRLRRDEVHLRVQGVRFRFRTTAPSQHAGRRIKPSVLKPPIRTCRHSWGKWSRHKVHLRVQGFGF